MKKKQYTIVLQPQKIKPQIYYGKGLQAQWDDSTILFDTQEEAEEMISLFPKLFNNVSIESGIYFIDNSINYKDLKIRKDFQEEINSNEEREIIIDDKVHCQNCCCLTECDGKWYCEQAGKFVEEVQHCPEGLFSRTVNPKPMNLQEALDTVLSPDNMGNFTPNELALFLVDNGIVENATDVNCMVIECLQKALNEDDEFPIHYYDKNEPMSEAGKVVDPGECLTDDFIENNFGS